MAGTLMEIEIDASEVSEELRLMQQLMTDQQFTNAIGGIFKRMGGHVKKILREDLPPKYYVKAGEINNAVQAPHIIGGGSTIGCIIPITGPRGSIGGHFTASGGAYGWNSVGRAYRIKAKIVKDNTSTLPGNLPTYGGMPPFRNLGSRLGGTTFTRMSRSRFPIATVVGIAVPQMPMNRSRPEVENDLTEFLEREVDRRLTALLVNGR